MQERRFLVYYEGGFASLAALKTAIRAKDSNTEIVAVTFIHVTETDSLTNRSDLESRAQTILAAAETNAQTNDVAIKTEIVAGAELSGALAQYAAECRAERIFIGRDSVPGDRAIARLTHYLAECAPSTLTIVS